jgi:hypothetical protein
MSHGVVDAEGVQITDSELLAAAMENSAQYAILEEVPEFYAYRRGNRFVNEYPRWDDSTSKRTIGTPQDPNHLLGTFPTLFPYGRGAFEIERKQDVSYERHVKWALSYHDRR